MGSNLLHMDPIDFTQPASELIRNYSDYYRNFKLTSGEMGNFAPNQEAVVEMVKDMSSPGLLHSWRSSGVLDEVYVLLSQISTHVSGYLNMPSANCGSGLSKGLSNMLSSNRLVHSSSKLGSNSAKGGVVEQKLNHDIINCSYL